jgi:uncharacterized membrane protein
MRNHVSKKDESKMIDKGKLHIAFCHRIPSRSFFFRGKQFPVCARCTGIHIGYLTFPFFMFNVFTLNIWWSVLLMIPTYIDGLTQAFFNRESTNLLRVTTGLISGIGSMSLISIIGKFIGDQILLIFN